MTKPAPIVYCIGTLGIGGAEQHLVQVMRHLDRKQWEPHVFALSEGGPLEADLRQLGVPVRIFGYEGLRVRRFVPGTITPLRSLAAAMREVRPAIVHSYLYWANVVGSLTARWVGVPVVISSRRSLGYFKDGKGYYQSLENLTNRYVDAITVNSQEVLQDVLRRERHVEGKIHLIYNGVEWKKFANAQRQAPALKKELGLPPDSLVVGCVANLIPYKGHRDLLIAFQSVKAQVPNAQLVLVGRDGGIQEELRSQAASLRIGDCVHFLGARRDVADLLHVFDLQVLASHEEGFSNVILEGMAAGLPLVVTRVGGNAEAVLDGETGLVVPPRAPSSMAEAICALLQNPDRAGTMGKLGQQRAKSVFSVTAMTVSLNSLYCELLGQTVKRPPDL